MIKMKSLKRVFLPMIGLAWMAIGPMNADAAGTTAGICTSTTVGTAATTVLAAYTGSAQSARRHIQIQMATNTTVNAAATYAWCTIGGTAANNVGYMLFGAATANSSTANVSMPNVWDIPPVQYPTSTFPMAPNGAISCIASAASQTITACVW